MKVSIRKAKPEEHEILTQISFAAKKYWNYPQEYFDVWKDELTISEDYVNNNTVFVAEADGEPAAYYSLVEVKQEFIAGKTKVEKGFWLEHMFVLPEFIGKGVGRIMYAHMKEQCRARDISKVRIFADPNAKGFYERMGAQYIEERPSSIEGRTVSLYVELL
jgi:GNAT superfamily N-acetyltransferase